MISPFRCHEWPPATGADWRTGPHRFRRTDILEEVVGDGEW
jgi:hypothetical protein